MAEGKNNEENNWENEAELHMMYVCPLFTAPDPGTETLFITFRKDCCQNIIIPNSEERCALNQLHIRSLMEFYSGRIMMESFLDA